MWLIRLLRIDEGGGDLWQPLLDMLAWIFGGSNG